MTITAGLVLCGPNETATYLHELTAYVYQEYKELIVVEQREWIIISAPDLKAEIHVCVPTPSKS